jgi:RNA polymerase sigma factor (sigma-70 family)
VVIAGRIGRNAALNYVGLKRPSIVPLQDPADLTTDKALKAIGLQVPNPSSDPTMLRELDQLRFQFALDYALRRLDPADRRCFVLHVVEGRTYEDIARTMRLPLGTVKPNVRRARVQLREMLRPWLGTDGSSA